MKKKSQETSDQSEGPKGSELIRMMKKAREKEGRKKTQTKGLKIGVRTLNRRVVTVTRKSPFCVGIAFSICVPNQTCR